MEQSVVERFNMYVQDTEISRKCIEKITSENTDAKFKNQIFEECFNSRVNILNALQKEQMEKN